MPRKNHRQEDDRDGEESRFFARLRFLLVMQELSHARYGRTVREIHEAMLHHVGETCQRTVYRDLVVLERLGLATRPDKSQRRVGRPDVWQWKADALLFGLPVSKIAPRPVAGQSVSYSPTPAAEARF